MIPYLPVFGICGYSGSGKTTLIVELIKRLSAGGPALRSPWGVGGLKVGVIKHDAHGLNVDREGKDSDRFFKAGADVLMRGPDQMFLRAFHSEAFTLKHRNESERGPRKETDLEAVLKTFGPRYDLVLLEGHKSTPFVDKVWLLKDDQEECPPEAVNVKRVLRRGEDRAGIAMEMLRNWLTEKWLATPVYAGVLIGGESLRMGRPKHLITTSTGRTWIELIATNIQPLANKVAILGKGEIPKSLELLPVLPDVDDTEGPLAGMLSAMRWRPDVSWLFLSCDMPWITTDAVRWLLTNRKPGVWAILPACSAMRPPAALRTAMWAGSIACPQDFVQRCRRAGRPRRTESRRWRDKSEGVEPLPGWYDFRALHLLEKCRGPAGLAGHAKVATPLIPKELAAAWTNVNTVSELSGEKQKWKVGASKSGKRLKRDDVGRVGC